MPTYGEWIRWQPKPTRRSVVMTPINPDITPEDLIAELSEPAHTLGLSSEDIASQFQGMDRMKYKDRTIGLLHDSQSVRVYVDEQLYTALVNKSAFLLGYQAVHVRTYSPPQYRCYNCNQVGTHQAGQCRQPRRTQLSWGDHMETEHLESSRKRPNE